MRKPWRSSAVVRRPVCPAAIGALILVAATAGSAAAQSWSDLEAQRVVISGIDVVIRDVFDLSRPSENNWIGRAANTLHLETRQHVVRRELLFAVGEVVDARRILETERNLRQLPFVRDARVLPGAVDATSVRARVEVADAWSLQADIELSRTGGNTRWGIEVEELNLFGRGKRLQVEHSQDLERTATGVGYTDPQLFGSRWVASLGYADFSDGSSRALLLERPYHSIETRYAIRGFAATSERLLTQYNQGEAAIVMPARQIAAALAASYAYRVRNRTAFRVGLTYRSEENRYDDVFTVRPGLLPDPDASTRRVREIMASWSAVQDRAATFQNLANIGRTEDYNLGWSVAAAAGYAAASWGSIAGAPSAEVSVRKGWRNGPAGLLLVDAASRGRREAGAWRDASAGAALTLYRPVVAGPTIALQFSAVASVRPDVADWLYLGGRNGLRGYVDHFLAGDRRGTFSSEDRLITSWRLLGLVQAGFVAYLDAGAIRRADTGQWSRTYANIGGGLRFGNLKSARSRLLQLSVAVPIVREPGMDRLLLVLGSPITF